MDGVSLFVLAKHDDILQHAPQLNHLFEETSREPLYCRL